MRATHVQHALLGELVRTCDEWHGHALLPRFAAVGELPEQQPAAPLGPPARPWWRPAELAGLLLAAAAFACLSLACWPFVLAPLALEWFWRPSPARLARERRRSERDATRAAEEHERLRRGLFPVTFAAPDRLPPRPEQDAAVARLLADPDRVFAAVGAAVFASFADAASQPYWQQFTGIAPADSPAALAGRYALAEVEVRREHRGAVAYLVFPFVAAWATDHGLFVVTHPDRPADWATADGLDELLAPDDADPAG